MTAQSYKEQYTLTAKIPVINYNRKTPTAVDICAMDNKASDENPLQSFHTTLFFLFF